MVGWYGNKTITIFILWICGFSVLGGALGEEAASGESRLVVLGLDSRLVFAWE